jgi:hypothetical protein
MRLNPSPKMSAHSSSIGPPTLTSTSPFSAIFSSPKTLQYRGLEVGD